MVEDRKRLGRRGVAAVFAWALLALPAAAQQIMAYPEKGQSQEQQDRDRFECYNWATQQTGFNPQQQAPASPGAAPPAGGGAVGGATRGAAVGAVGGAIGGNAGKGAAIGAATGGLIGGMRRNERERQQAQAQQQQSAANASQMDAFNRAMGACLRGRGYSIG